MHIDDIVGKIQKNLINIVVLVACLIASWVVYNYQRNQTGALEELREMEKQKSAVLADIGRLERRMKMYKKRINTRVDGAQKTDVSIVDTLNMIAKEANIKNMVFRRLPETEEKGFKRLGLGLNFSVDSYHTIGKFISAVENHNDFLIIESMSLRQETSNDNKKSLVVDLQVSTITVTD